MANIFNTFLYQPIFTALVFTYEHIAFESLGLAIILITIAIRIILFPLFYKQAETQAVMQKVQPKLKKIKDDHKDDKERQMTETMKLYKDHKINPFSGFLVLLVQLPILIGLYRVLLKEIPGTIFDNALFLGFIDLSVRSMPIAVIAAALQYVHAKMSMASAKTHAGEGPAASAGKMMMYIAPGITLAILTTLPAALGIYWLTSTVFSIGQQVIVNKKIEAREENEGTGEQLAANNS